MLKPLVILVVLLVTTSVSSQGHSGPLVSNTYSVLCGISGCTAQVTAGQRLIFTGNATSTISFSGASAPAALGGSSIVFGLTDVQLQISKPKITLDYDAVTTCIVPTSLSVTSACTCPDTPTKWGATGYLRTSETYLQGVFNMGSTVLAGCSAIDGSSTVSSQITVTNDGTTYKLYTLASEPTKLTFASLGGTVDGLTVLGIGSYTITENGYDDGSTSFSPLIGLHGWPSTSTLHITDSGKQSLRMTSDGTLSGQCWWNLDTAEALHEPAMGSYNAFVDYVGFTSCTDTVVSSNSIDLYTAPTATPTSPELKFGVFGVDSAVIPLFSTYAELWWNQTQSTDLHPEQVSALAASYDSGTNTLSVTITTTATPTQTVVLQFFCTGCGYIVVTIFDGTDTYDFPGVNTAKVGANWGATYFETAVAAPPSPSPTPSASPSVGARNLRPVSLSSGFSVQDTFNSITSTGGGNTPADTAVLWIIILIIVLVILAFLYMFEKKYHCCMRYSSYWKQRYSVDKPYGMNVDSNGMETFTTVTRRSTVARN